MFLRELSDVIDLCVNYYGTPEAFQHCVRVAKMAATNPAIESQDEAEVIYQVALCHDLLEDTDCTMEEIAEATNSSMSFIENVLGLLTRKKDETYMDYIKRIRSSRNLYAYVIKLSDIKDHLNLDETLTDSLQERYVNALKILL